MPLIAIEVVMVFGGVLLFGWWQLRSVRKDQAAAAARRAEETAAPSHDETGVRDERVNADDNRQPATRPGTRSG